jgi:hypothetical protein
MRHILAEHKKKEDYMKKCGFIMILLFGILLSVNSQEPQKENDFKFSIQTNAAQLPLELLLNGLYAALYGNMTDVYIWSINIEFQYALNNYFAISLMPMFGVSGSPWYKDGKGNEYFADYLSYSLTAGFLFHPFGTRLKGWYFGLDPRIGMQHIKTDVTDNLLDIGFMAIAGQQWIRPSGFTISYWFGVGSSWFVPINGNKYEWKKEHLFGLPIDFGGNLSIGYSF